MIGIVSLKTFTLRWDPFDFRGFKSYLSCKKGQQIVPKKIEMWGQNGTRKWVVEAISSQLVFFI